MSGRPEIAEEVLPLDDPPLPVPFFAAHIANPRQTPDSGREIPPLTAEDEPNYQLWHAMFGDGVSKKWGDSYQQELKKHALKD
jgi:hypothetical protein